MSSPVGLPRPKKSKKTGGIRCGAARKEEKLKNLIKTIISSCSSVINNRCEAVACYLNDRNFAGAIINFALLVLYILFVSAVVLGAVTLAVRFWQWLVIPGIILLLIFKNAGEKPKDPLPPPPPEGIKEARARAEKTYPIMKQVAFILLGNLCQYLPGLVAPFSLAAVVTPVPFEITANLVTIYHFIVAKGESVVDTVTVQEILTGLLEQHLAAQDLPITVNALYTAQDGSTWPGIVVDGVYDAGNNFRVDLVITNESAVVRMKAKAAANFDGIVPENSVNDDPDF